MDCNKAQEEILEFFDTALDLTVQTELAVHVAGCEACTAFVARLKTLDVHLSDAFRPPELSPAFRTVLRTELRERIRREPERLWPEWLPDALHFATCGLATVACAPLLPFAAYATLAAGSIVTILMYLLLTGARVLFEGFEDSEAV
jgi:anti-sigma factor RsiW